MAAHQAPVPGILQARILEWVAISFSSAWKWKVKVKSLSRVRLFATPWTVVYHAPPSMGFPRQEYWSGVPSPSLTYHRLWSPKAKLKSRSGPLPRTPPYFKFDLLLSNCSSALGSWPWSCTLTSMFCPISGLWTCGEFWLRLSALVLLIPAHFRRNTPSKVSSFWSVRYRAITCLQVLIEGTHSN